MWPKDAYVRWWREHRNHDNKKNLASLNDNSKDDMDGIATDSARENDLQKLEEQYLSVPEGIDETSKKSLVNL